MKLPLCLLLGAILTSALAACSGPAQTSAALPSIPAKSAPTTIAASPVFTATFPQTKSPTPSHTPTLPATQTPTPTHISPSDDEATRAARIFEPFPTPIPGPNLSMKCIPIEDRDTKTIASEGILIASPDFVLSFPGQFSGSLMDLETGSSISIPNGRAPSPQQISPDHTHYFAVVKSPNGTSKNLVVFDHRGIGVASYPWDDRWGWDPHWLDSRRIIASVPHPLSEYDPSAPILSPIQYGTTFIIDPFSRLVQEIKPEFVHDLNIDQLIISYSPQLDAAIFHAGSFFKLWTPTNTFFLREQGYAILGWFPSWSADGSKVLVEFWDDPGDSDRLRKTNLYFITKDGQVSRLTKIADQYPTNYSIVTYGAQSSPDGRYVSLLVRVGDQGHNFVGPNLFLLDLTTQKMVDTCLTSAADTVAWSPDGSQLAVTIPVDLDAFLHNDYGLKKNDTNVIVIDLAKWQAVEAAKGTTAIGWLTGGPKPSGE